MSMKQLDGFDVRQLDDDLTSEEIARELGVLKLHEQFKSLQDKGRFNKYLTKLGGKHSIKKRSGMKKETRLWRFENNQV